MSSPLPPVQSESQGQVLLRRLLWGLGLGGLLLFEALALLLILAWGLMPEPSSSADRYDGFGLMILFCLGCLLASAMGMVGLMSGIMFAGLAPRGAHQKEERRRYWRRLLKSGTGWTILGLLSIPSWMILSTHVLQVGALDGILGAPLTSLAGMMWSLKRELKFKAHYDGQG